MPMTVETALVTKKALNAQFNTDSVNASGKTWPRETVHGDKGIKAVGTGKDVPYYVLSSSESMGTAESAADLFKSCTDIFSHDMTNCSEVIAEFYVSFAKVLNEAGFGSDECDLSVFCGYGADVYISKCGKAKLFRYSDGNFSEVVPQMFDFSDGKSAYGVGVYNDNAPGDIFIMLNGYVASVLPADLLSAICRSAGGDIKKLVSIIANQAEKFGCKGAVSAVVIKITEVDASQNVPVAAYENNVEEGSEPEYDSTENAETAAAPVLEDAVSDSAETETAQEDIPKAEEKNNSTGSKVGFGIVLGIFCILVIILAVLGIRGINRRHEADVTSPDIIIDETVTDETTGEAESETTTEKADETTTEEVTDETTTEAASTERATQPQNDTPSTQPPVTQEPTTQPPAEEESTTQPEPTEEPSTEAASEPESQNEENTDGGEDEPEPESSNEPAGEGDSTDDTTVADVFSID